MWQCWSLKTFQSIRTQMNGSASLIVNRKGNRVADYIRERTWHPSQEIVECENCDVILSMTVNHLLELKSWILSWGEDAQVLEPDYFVKDIVTTLKKTTELYSPA